MTCPHVFKLLLCVATRCRGSSRRSMRSLVNPTPKECATPMNLKACFSQMAPSEPFGKGEALPLNLWCKARPLSLRRKKLGTEFRTMPRRAG